MAEKKRISDVYLSSGHICLRPFGCSEYPIEISRIDSHAKITSWIMHLSEKNWVTLSMILSMILLACKENKLNAYTHT